MTKSERIEIRISPELKKQVQKLAQEQNCTVSKLIEDLLINAVRESGVYIPGVTSYFKSL